MNIINDFVPGKIGKSLQVRINNQMITHYSFSSVYKNIYIFVCGILLIEEQIIQESP